MNPLRGVSDVAREPWFPARHEQLLLANIEMCRMHALAAIAEGEDPIVVVERAMDFIRGFVSRKTAMIVPPELVDPDELAAAVAFGRELAEKYGWAASSHSESPERPA